MEQRELRSVTSLGMFDLFKGVTILGVVFGHSWQLFSEGATPLLLLLPFLLEGFFLAGGYSLRPKKWKLTVKQASRMFLRPYLYAAAGTLLGTLAVGLLLRQEPGSLLRRLGSILAGFALGQYPDAAYFGFTVSSVGPLWFVVAMAEGWILLSASLKHGGEKPTAVLAALLCLLSPLFYGRFSLPFCLDRLCEAVPGLYLGTRIRSRSLLEKKPPLWFWALAAACAAFFGAFYLGRVPMVLSFLALPAAYCAAFAALYIFTHINRRYNALIGFFEWVGHNSMWVLCLHTVEYFCGHWQTLAAHLPESLRMHPTAGALLFFAVRLSLILTGVYVLERIEEKRAGA